METFAFKNSQTKIVQPNSFTIQILGQLLLTSLFLFVLLIFSVFLVSISIAVSVAWFLETIGINLTGRLF